MHTIRMYSLELDNYSPMVLGAQRVPQTVVEVMRKWQSWVIM